MKSLLLQNAIFEGGNSLGYISAWILTILFILLWSWVMYKYLDTSDLNH